MDTFYQKMTTFGMVPDLKFIEHVTTITYQNRPKQIPAAGAAGSSSKDNRSANKAKQFGQKGSQMGTISRDVSEKSGLSQMRVPGEKGAMSSKNSKISARGR